MFSRVPVGKKRGPKGADGGIQIGSRRMQQKWKDLQAGVTALDVRNTATYLVQGSPPSPCGFWLSYSWAKKEEHPWVESAVC